MESSEWRVLKRCERKSVVILRGVRARVVTVLEVVERTLEAEGV